MLLELEQERQAFLAKEVELAAARQQLRAARTEGSAAPGAQSHGGGSVWGSEGGHGSNSHGDAGGYHHAQGKRPLTMAGWEDLIEEASADLERLEGHVCTTSQRLIELQARNVQLAEAVGAAMQQRLEAEQQVQAAELGAKVGGGKGVMFALFALWLVNAACRAAALAT